MQPRDQLLKNFSLKAGSGQRAQVVYLVVVTVLVVLAGIGTGWALTRGEGTSVRGVSTGSAAAEKKVNGGTVVGIVGEDLGEDGPEGMLRLGGIGGEGTHHLDRGLGEDKNVYLTSTVLDLGRFEGKKVQVWGNTVAGQSAGWLMEVTRVKSLE